MISPEQTQTTQPSPNIIGMITPEAADQLMLGDERHYGSPAEQTLRSIGAKLVLGEITEPGYALVVGKDEETGGAKPDRYVVIDSSDLGTRVREENNDRLGLPDPKQKFEELVAEAHQAERSKTPDSAEKEPVREVQQEKENSHVTLSPDQIMETAAFMSNLEAASMHGGIESSVRSALDSVVTRYTDKPDEFKKMMFTWGSIAAGAVSDRNAMDPIVDALHRTDILSQEDQSRFLNVLNTVYQAKTNPGMRPGEGVYHAREVLVRGLQTLAGAEKSGKDVADLRLATASMLVGVMTGAPEQFRTNATSYMQMLQNKYKSS